MTPITIYAFGKKINGFIAQIEGLDVILALEEKLPDPIFSVKMEIDTSFLLKQLRERLKEITEGRILLKPELIFPLLGDKKYINSVIQEIENEIPDELNEEQKEAFKKCVSRNNHFIWGPPGTGKTKTLMEIVYYLYKNNNSVLVVSNTNIAVDNLMEKLGEKLRKKSSHEKFESRPQIVRFGNVSKDTEIPEEFKIEYWEKRYQTTIEQQINDYEEQYRNAQEEIMNLEKAYECMIRKDKLHKDYNSKNEKLREVTERERNLEKELKKANKRKTDLKEKLKLSLKSNIFIRIVKGLDPSKLKKQLIDAEKEYKQVEMDLIRVKKVKKEVKEKIEDLQSQIKLEEEVLRKLTSLKSKEEIEHLIESENENLKLLSGKIKELTKYREMPHNKIFYEAGIIGTTFAQTFLKKEIYKRRFHTVIVDEASMGLIPAIIFACSLAESKIIICGDFLQLPPVAHTEELRKDIFEISGITKDIRNRNFSYVTALRKEYRMPRIVRDTLSFHFYQQYNSKLEYTGKEGFCESEKELILNIRNQKWFPQDIAGDESVVIIIDTSDFNPWCSKSQTHTSSPLNFYHACLAVYLMGSFYSKYYELKEEGKEWVSKVNFAYMTPYTAQATLFRNLFDLGKENGRYTLHETGTVHTMQGREKYIVILDLVEGKGHKPKWLNTEKVEDESSRLLNVAFSRVRAKLFIIANLKYLFNTLKEKSILRRILEYIKNYERNDKRYCKIISSRKIWDFIEFPRESTAKITIRRNEVMFTTEREFFDLLNEDIRKCRDGGEVFIGEPFEIRERNIRNYLIEFRTIILNGGSVVVFSKKKDIVRNKELAEYLKEIGIKILPTSPKMHEKFTLICPKGASSILWVGSMNPFSHTSTTELMVRFLLPYEKVKNILKMFNYSIDIELIKARLKIKELNEQRILCSECNTLSAVIKRGRYGFFIKCNKCGHTEDINLDLLEKIFGEELIRCDNPGCKSLLTIKKNWRTKRSYLRCLVCGKTKSIPDFDIKY